MMPAAFDAFSQKAPLCVIARIALERLFSDEHLDQLFERTAQRQQHRNVLFSQIFELMMSVVLRADKSVLAAYRKRADVLGVSDEAIYQKLQRQELCVSEAIVSDSAERLTAVIDELGVRHEPLLPGYRVKILDGNHLQASERRLKELRQTWARGLPGQALAVYEPETDLVTNVMLAADGHASERSLLDQVIPVVRQGDVWIADRNFHTREFLLDIAQKGGFFVIRKHKSIPCELLRTRKKRGRCETGTIYEQRAVTTLTVPIEDDDAKDGGKGSAKDGAKRAKGGTKSRRGKISAKTPTKTRRLKMRCVTIDLDEPTRDGERQIHVLTNLPKEVTAKKVAELYRKRWRIEHRFYEVTQTLQCEPNTLGYPKAALFAFCLAMTASNAMAMVKASLRAVHDKDVVAEMSHYYLALDMVEPLTGMLIILPPEQWREFQTMPVAELAILLRKIAKHVDLKKYRKAKRGPKKPQPHKTICRRGSHVATQQLIDARK